MSAQQQYIDSVITLYTNLNILKKNPNDYKNEIIVYKSYRKQYASDPNLKKITDDAVKMAIAEYEKNKPSSTIPSTQETNDYVKATKTLYIQLNLLKGDKANFPNEISVRQNYIKNYSSYPDLKTITDNAINEAISEQSSRSNQTLSSKTSNPLLVLKQAIMKNYRLKLDKKVMKNNALNEMISESDRNVLYFKQQVKPEDIQNVEEKALYDFLVIVVRNYINPIKNNSNKLALKMVYDNEIDDLISKNAFLTDKRQEIVNLANDDNYVILEGFRISEGFKHIGIY